MSSVQMSEVAIGGPLADVECQSTEPVKHRTARRVATWLLAGLAMVVLAGASTTAAVILTRETHVDSNALVSSTGETVAVAASTIKRDLNLEVLLDAKLDEVNEVSLAVEGGEVGFHVTRYSSVNGVVTLHGADGVKIVVSKQGSYFDNGDGTASDSSGPDSANTRRLWGLFGWFTAPATSPAPPPAPHAEPENPLEFWDCFFECAQLDGWTVNPSEACWRCVGATNVGQLPISCTSDLLQAKLGTGYTEMWCGAEDLPSGWHADGSGGFTGCEVTDHFPGLDSTSHQSHAYVKAEMATLPALQNSGEVWRGNELGFIISNEKFWPNVSPRSVLLGASVKQHKVIRPIIMDLFSTCDAACEAKLTSSALALFSARSGGLHVQNDVKEWVFQRLFEITFPGVTNPIDASEFVGVQSSFTTLSTITQLLGDGLGDAIAGSTISSLENYFEALYPLVGDRFGAQLAGTDCAPTKDCVAQLTSGILDTLLAAGGLSVPGAISTALFVLYGDTEATPDIFPVNYQFDQSDPLPFYYESMRFFAPVVGFPWWTTAPDRATDDYANQYEGGIRKVLNMALANKDPNVFGANAHKFEVKSIEKYHADFLGFADFATDAAVADGAMDRKCPGKALALSMGKVWFANWDQDAWCTNDESTYTEATPFVGEFTLHKGRKSGQECTQQWPWEDSQCCSGHCGSYWKNWYSLGYKCD